MTERRTVLKMLGATLAAPALLPTVGRAADAIKIATILDMSGDLDLYGKPMHLAAAMAVDEINQEGGLGGRQVEIVAYDTQSNMQLYAQFAQQAALKDKVSAVHGAITSASREVIRPILDRYKTLLVYPVQYEGGVCDKNTFCLGPTPTMQVREPVKWAIEKYGKRVFFVGADYNAPRITADWTKKYAADFGGEMVAAEFLPLTVGEFGPVITKIQQEKPDVIVSMLVGAAHAGFYRQWAAAGLLEKFPIMSFTFGIGNEHILLPPADTNGIIAPYDYFQEIDTPANKDFLERLKAKFGADAPAYVGSTTVAAYYGIKVWAEGVKKAGTDEREAVIAALESGIEYSGPAGLNKVNGKTHHATRDMFLGQLKDGKWDIIQEWPQQSADDMGDRCDLIANPSTNEQFLPL